VSSIKEETAMYVDRSRIFHFAPARPRAPRPAQLAGACAAVLCLLACAAGARAPFPAEVDLHALRASQGGDGSEGVVFRREPPCVDCTAVFGQHVSGLGDVTGDGVDDLIVGDPKSVTPDDVGEGGDSYVLFGHTPPFPPEIPTTAFPLRLESDTALTDDGVGVVARIGDINADGFEDIGVSGPDLQVDGVGRVYVVYGRAGGFPAVLRLQDLETGDGTEGVVFIGASTDDNVGFSLAGDCDVNADGIDDLIVGAPGTDLLGADNVGAVGIVWGSTDFPAVFELSALLPGLGGDGSQGTIVEGIREDITRAGAAVSCAGDVDGDGVDDVLLAEDDRSDTVLARSYLYLGHPEPFPARFPLSDLYPANGGDGTFGTVIDAEVDVVEVSGAGDVDGDGIDDMLFGTPSATAGGRSLAGEAFVLYGSAAGFGGQLSLESLRPQLGGDGSAGYVARGARVGDRAGASLAGAGDTDGDGFDDVLIGAPGLEGDGTVFLVYGGGPVTAQLNLSSLLEANGGDGQVGVVLHGEPASENGPGGAGGSVAGAGDVDDDGFADLLVGASDEELTGGAGEGGAAYLVFGRSRVADTDSDGDGVADRTDNCTLVANADQRDTDADGYGNVCDADLDNDCLTGFLDLGIFKSVFLTNDPDADMNGDQIVNFIDLGILKTLFFAPPGPSEVGLICN
jgi:hypothetical protein